MNVLNLKKNEITIANIKDSWNRIEVEDLLESCLRSFRRDCLPFGEYPDIILIDFLKKFKQKL